MGHQERSKVVRNEFKYRKQSLMGFLNTVKTNKCRTFSDRMGNTRFSINDNKVNHLKDDISVVLKNIYRILKHLGESDSVQYKAFLPTSALSIKNIKYYSLYLQYLFIWLPHVSVPVNQHQGACNGTLLKLQLLQKSSVKIYR